MEGLHSREEHRIFVDRIGAIADKFFEFHPGATWVGIGASTELVRYSGENEDEPSEEVQELEEWVAGEKVHLFVNQPDRSQA